MSRAHTPRYQVNLISDAAIAFFMIGFGLYYLILVSFFLYYHKPYSFINTLCNFRGLFYTVSLEFRVLIQVHAAYVIVKPQTIIAHFRTMFYLQSHLCAQSSPKLPAGQGCSHSFPVNPGPHRQVPVTGEHWALFLHLQFPAHPLP